MLHMEALYNASKAPLSVRILQNLHDDYSECKENIGSGCLPDDIQATQILIEKLKTICPKNSVSILGPNKIKIHEKAIMFVIKGLIFVSIIREKNDEVSDLTNMAEKISTFTQDNLFDNQNQIWRNMFGNELKFSPLMLYVKKGKKNKYFFDSIVLENDVYTLEDFMKIISLFIS